MKERKTFENFIFIAIILVIIQTFLDEYSRFANFPVNIRHILLITGFLFDLIFTIEFILRTIWSLQEKKFRFYFFYNRGWVDFLASVPLLAFNSLPMLILYLQGSTTQVGEAISILNVLKTVKAIRVTRILRLIRILKIFGKIHNAESKMALRHTQTITTTGIFSLITLFVILSLFRFNKADHLLDYRITRYENIIENLENINRTLNVPLKDLAFKMLANDENVIKLKYAGILVFRNISEDHFKKYYDFEDYLTIKAGEFTLLVSLIDINKLHAGMNIQNFLMIVILIIVYMIFYTRHFVQTISDVVHIIIRGFKEKDYNLQVKIPEQYKDDEIFILAKEYNENYLPLKAKLIQEEKEKKATVLSMDDLLNFGKKE